MVGGGIFTILGISVAMIGVFIPIAIILGGVIAALAAYAYVKLGVYYYQDGGLLIRFLNALSSTHLLYNNQSL